MMNLLRGQRIKLTELCGKQNLHEFEFFIRTSMLSQNNATYDIGCFGVDEFGKCSDERFFIFFNQKVSPGGGIELLDVTSINESLTRINIRKLPETIKKLVFTATVDADESLSELKRGELELIFESKTIGSFLFNGESFSDEKSIIIGEIYFKGDWRFSAVGQGFNGGLSALLEYFDIEEDTNEENQHEHETTPEPVVAEPAVIVESKWGVPSFIRNLLSIPLKNSENKNNLKRFQEILGEYLADGELTLDEIINLKAFCQEKNISLESALLDSSQQVNIFLRGMLANIISDGEITQEEESIIKTACDFLNPSISLVNEINSTIERIKLISIVRKGNIPAINIHNFVSSNNELVWYNSDELKLIRQLSQTLKTYRGHVIVTSERVIFKSQDHPVEVPLKSIIDIEYNASHLYIISKSKSKTCQFRLNNAELLGVYIEQALAKFHRKLNFQQDGKKSRVIPQNIKQAVWLRDAGQCVECDATEYLEFDHIIPFSKGGANSESNIQLLCRKCNLKKSDKI